MINVAIIFGGASSEHEVSKASAINIINNINKEKYNVIPIYVTPKGKWLLYDGNLDNVKNIEWEKFGTQAVISPDTSHNGILRLTQGKFKSIPIDVAFPVLHGKNGEDGTIQGLLDLAKIPYVGCNVYSSAISMDKALTKIMINYLGIEQAKYLTFTEHELNIETMCKEIRYKIGYPCFVKPSRAGSSIGINKVHNKRELMSAILEAFEFDNKIVVEKAVNGREIECAVLGRGYEDTIASTPGEILTGAEFYDFDAKYNNKDSKIIIPALIKTEKEKEVKEKSLKIFKALGCSGLSRVDFFLEDKTDKIIFNEINTMPGFTDISMYSMLINNMGITTEKLIDKLIDIALQ